MNPALALALRRLGYRQTDEDPKIWVKPIGFGLFVVKVEVPRIEYWVMGAQKLQLWTSETLTLDDEQDIEPSISYFENYNCRSGAPTAQLFGFLTIADREQILAAKL